MKTDDVLDPEATEFLTLLQREFGEERQELLAARQARAQRLREGELPDFLDETRAIRAGRTAAICASSAAVPGSTTMWRCCGARTGTRYRPTRTPTVSDSGSYAGRDGSTFSPREEAAG